MKILLSFFFFSLSSFSFCHAQDSLGIDTNKIPNRQEALFLNEALANNRGDFDFNNKKVAFITGSSGRIIVTKSQYFKAYVKASDDRRVHPQMFMVVLSKEEKAASGGYDVLVFTWVKVAYSDKLKKQMIEKLNENENSDKH